MEVIERDTDRDNYMTAEDAKTFGLIDTVINERPRPLEKDSGGGVTPLKTA